MKPPKTIFKWIWDNKPPTDDLAMNRQRAASLLKSWRADPRKRCYKIGTHTYSIVNLDYAAPMIMIIQQGTES